MFECYTTVYLCYTTVLFYIVFQKNNVSIQYVLYVLYILYTTQSSTTDDEARTVVMDYYFKRYIFFDSMRLDVNH